MKMKEEIGETQRSQPHRHNFKLQKPISSLHLHVGFGYFFNKYLYSLSFKTFTGTDFLNLPLMIFYWFYNPLPCQITWCNCVWIRYLHRFGCFDTMHHNRANCNWVTFHWDTESIQFTENEFWLFTQILNWKKVVSLSRTNLVWTMIVRSQYYSNLNEKHFPDGHPLCNFEHCVYQLEHINFPNQLCPPSLISLAQERFAFISSTL